jgi:hypothetical protein
LPSAVLVRFGRCATVRFRFAAVAAFLMLRRAAERCFDDAILVLFDSREVPPRLIAIYSPPMSHFARWNVPTSSPPATTRSCLAFNTVSRSAPGGTVSTESSANTWTDVIVPDVSAAGESGLDLTRQLLSGKPPRLCPLSAVGDSGASGARLPKASPSGGYTGKRLTRGVYDQNGSGADAPPGTTHRTYAAVTTTALHLVPPLRRYACGMVESK